nr:hypothetical protein Iba_chr12bCG0100 [Ipomoea batatas]
MTAAAAAESLMIRKKMQQSTYPLSAAPIHWTSPQTCATPSVMYAMASPRREALSILEMFGTTARFRPRFRGLFSSSRPGWSSLHEAAASISEFSDSTVGEECETMGLEVAPLKSICICAAAGFCIGEDCFAALESESEENEEKQALIDCNMSKLSCMDLTDPNSTTPTSVGIKTIVCIPANFARNDLTQYSIGDLRASYNQKCLPDPKHFPGPPSPLGKEKYMEARKNISVSVTLSNPKA